MKKIKVISCAITLAIMTLIFFFSSQNSIESASTSHSLTMWFLSYIPVFSGIEDYEKFRIARRLSFVVRKTAHFTIYAALGASSSVSFRLLSRKSNKKVFLMATVFCMLYAVSDEMHQWFVSGRAGRISDVCIDTVGAAVGHWLYRIAYKIKVSILNKVEEIV